MPNYLISASNDSVVLRNYEGMLINYHPTGAPPERHEPVATHGVSGLLEGQAEVLIPEGNPRLLRRRSRFGTNGNGHGKSFKNGHANDPGPDQGHGQGNGKRGPTP